MAVGAVQKNICCNSTSNAPHDGRGSLVSPFHKVVNERR